MADQKISELVQINIGDLADEDEFVIADASASDNKSITWGEIRRRTGGVFATRAEFVSENTAGALDSIEDGAVVFADGFAYKRESGATVIPDMPGWKPSGDVTPDHWADNTTPGATDMTAAVQSANDYATGIGGANVYFAPVQYAISDTILLSRNVYFCGQGWFFNSDYVDDALNITGSIIKALPDTNADLVLARADISDLDGFPRHHAGLRDICIYGNRSGNQNPGVQDTNTSGRGVVASGISYFTLDNVLIFRCAGDGARAESYDYGDGEGDRSCNNFYWRKVSSISNGGDGFSLFGGDSTLTQLVGGYNAENGYSGSMGPLTVSRFWNNFQRGVSISGKFILANCNIYGNKLSGVFAGGDRITITGNSIYSNGLDAGSATETAGIQLGNNVTNFNISGNNFGNKPSLGNKQERGIYSSGGTISGVIGANVFDQQSTADIDLHDYSDVFYLSNSTDAPELQLPPLTMGGKILQNGHLIEQNGNTKLIDTDGVTVATLNEVGEVSDIIVSHIAGTVAAWCRASSDGTTAFIISQETAGSNSITFSVDDNDVVATSLSDVTSVVSEKKLI